MSSIDIDLAAITDEKARAVLRRLHAESSREVWKLIWHFLPYFPRMFAGKKLPWDRIQHTHDRDYMACTPSMGVHSYLLARALGAHRIVEFGTSFAISTIYLALAVRDNGGGLVIGTEMVHSKVLQARLNIADAGLSDYVDIREGNALETLRDLDPPLDFFSSDGFPQYALPVLQLVAPKLRRGAVVVNHNTAGLKGDHADYLTYVRNLSNGFLSGSTPLAGEFSVRVVEPSK